MSDSPERYRHEQGVACIDIRVNRIEQLFDNRDPAPFHERDLDTAAVEYLIAAVDEIPPAAGPFKIVVWVGEAHGSSASAAADASLGPATDPASLARVVDAFARHFGYARQRLQRTIREQQRQSRWFALLGLVALGVLLGLAELLSGLRSSPVGHVLPEGLTVLAWVVLWRPLEVLVYDWWPLRQERHRLERLGAAPVEVRRAARPL